MRDNLSSSKFKVAAVQAAPVILDRDATIEKACALIQEAGASGARLIGFPEGFVPGYPFWIWRIGPMGRGAELYAELYRNAVEIPSDAVTRLGNAARAAAIYVCISVTERSGASLYLTQLWFDPTGALVAKHRKLRPTGPERVIWGDGDGSMMPIIKSPIGNLGGLQCWEHLVPLISAAMSGMNEQVHVASWPTIAYLRSGPFESMRDFKARSEIASDLPYDIAPNEIMSRHYAMATQTFVIMSTSMIDGAAARLLEGVVPQEDFRIGVGGSRIIAPDGSLIGKGVSANEEGLVYAEIALDMVVHAKYMCDPAGHYAVPNVLSLNFNRASVSAVKFDGPCTAAAPVEAMHVAVESAEAGHSGLGP